MCVCVSMCVCANMLKNKTIQLIFTSTDVPDVPVISSSASLSDVVENTVIAMTCSARSTTTLPSNLPSDLKPVMEYQWQRNNRKLTNDGRHRVSGNRLTIDKVQRQDNMVTYSCIAQESGSKLSRAKDIRLNVKCKYIPIVYMSYGIL